MELSQVKVGQKVFCTNNSIWDKEPMEVTFIWPHGSIRCKHPIYGDGGFEPYNLKLAEPKFKLDDKVFATKNSFWGLEPMKVVMIHSFGMFTVKHPKHGDGGFFPCELELASDTRVKLLALLQKAEENAEETAKLAKQQVETLKKTIFGE